MALCGTEEYDYYDTQMPYLLIVYSRVSPLLVLVALWGLLTIRKIEE